MPPRIRLTSHAVVVSQARGIERDWVERVAIAPDWMEVDPSDPALNRAFGAIAEAGDRILRVVYADRAGERVIITVHFDRNAQRRRMSTRP